MAEPTLICSSAASCQRHDHQGWSGKPRSYRLWVRLAGQPHNGDGVVRGREAKVRVIVGGEGSRFQVSSRITTGSGTKR